MAAPSRGRSATFSHSCSAPDLSPLGSFSVTPASTPDPEDQTPAALRDSGHPPPAFSTDGEEEDDEAEEADFHSHYSLDAPSDSDPSTSDSDSDHGRDDPMNKQRPYLHHSNSSLLAANAFAPPFYNKPPTPLPPSPSLTSLLRPSFSATTSRPTTPDSSENDTPNDTEAAVAKSARTATTVPRASPKVPTYEYYGFVLYLISSLAFPLAAYNTEYLTLPMNSIENIVDEAANIAVIEHRRSAKVHSMHRSNASTRDWADLWDEGTDAVMDVPIGGICQILYGSG
ncbi:MAG: hypothetical protein Q9216_005304 [Gyalolechia sp. 2 TL-2023]